MPQQRSSPCLEPYSQQSSKAPQLRSEMKTIQTSRSPIEAPKKAAQTLSVEEGISPAPTPVRKQVLTNVYWGGRQKGRSRNHRVWRRRRGLWNLTVCTYPNPGRGFQPFLLPFQEGLRHLGGPSTEKITILLIPLSIYHVIIHLSITSSFVYLSIMSSSARLSFYLSLCKLWLSGYPVMFCTEFSPSVHMVMVPLLISLKSGMPGDSLWPMECEHPRNKTLSGGRLILRANADLPMLSAPPVPPRPGLFQLPVCFPEWRHSGTEPTPTPKHPLPQPAAPQWTWSTDK